MKAKPLGNTLSLFLSISFLLCFGWGLTMPPSLHMHYAWAPFLPGFNWSPLGVLIGLVGAYVYGWYIALVFVPLYNFFHRGAK